MKSISSLLLISCMSLFSVSCVANKEAAAPQDAPQVPAAPAAPAADLSPYVFNYGSGDRYMLEPTAPYSGKYTHFYNNTFVKSGTYCWDGGLAKNSKKGELTFLAPSDDLWITFYVTFTNQAQTKSQAQWGEGTFVGGEKEYECGSDMASPATFSATPH